VDLQSGQVVFSRGERAAAVLPPIPELTPDEGVWRVDWLGELSYPVTVPMQSQPSMQVTLSALHCRPDDHDALLLPSATDHAHQRDVWVPVGVLPMIAIGSLWRKGAALARAPYEEAEFVNVAVNGRSAAIVKAGLSLDEGFLLPLDEHPGHRHHTQSYCVCVTLSEGKRLIVPCLELLRFYFGSSSHLIHRLAHAPLRDEALWQAKRFDEKTRHLHLDLAGRLSGASAADIGRIALSKAAWQAASTIHASCIKHASLREPVYPYCPFPFYGKTSLRASGRWLSHAGVPRSTFLVFQLLSCSHPFPFASLSYEVGGTKAFRRRQRGSNKMEKGTETVAQLRHAEDRPKLSNRDPTRGRTRRTRPNFGAERFPDLKRKPVWLERVDLAAPAGVLLRRPDGSFDLVSFGEPTHTGAAGRGLDVVAAATAQPFEEGDTPGFLRLALRQAEQRFTRKGIAPRIELLTPSGYTQPVFTLPLLVDEQGVIDPVTVFTRSSGGTRQRQGCFVRLSAPKGERVYGVLMILEGATHRDPPTLNEVPAPEVSFVARILGKVSIASAQPS